MTAVLAGVAVLAGWFFDIARLKRISAGLADMKPNTALCIILSGVSLLLMDANQSAPAFRRTARAAILAVFSVSLATILEFSFHRDLGIDQALFRDTPDPNGLSMPGRMSLLTAIDFMILSGALLLLDYKTRKGFWPSPVLTLAAGIPSMLGLTGYVYSIVWLYRPFSHSAMAVHTSIILLMMSMAALCARPNHGPLAVILSDGPGGLMARRILPASILFPLVVGWLRLEGQRRGWYGLEVGLAIFTVSSIVVLTSLVYWTSAESDRRDIERRGIEDASERLRAASLAKDQFLSSMSHELRTPLNAVIGYTGTLLMKLPGPLTQDQEKQLLTIQNAGKHLLSLLNDLLNLAKVEAGKMELRLEAFAVHEAIDEVVKTLRPLAQEKNIRLEAVEGNTATVRADRRALRQILMNLVGNAIKFTEKGAVKLEMGEVPENDRVWAAVHVTDDGMGIRREDKIRLFQAFEQLDLTMAPVSGSGLGLHLSQKLAVAMGGRIEVTSEYGKGSRFTLLIPKG